VKVISIFFVSGLDSLIRQENAMKTQFKSVWGRLPAALVAAGLLVATGPGYATEQGQQRREARDTRQDTRQESRETKADCRADDQKSNPECRQDKRETKQEGRQEARDIKY
jgi:hypothetical protein